MDISFNNKLVSNLLSYNMYIISKGKSKVWGFWTDRTHPTIDPRGWYTTFCQVPPKVVVIHF